jgi:hypothetical protein
MPSTTCARDDLPMAEPRERRLHLAPEPEYQPARGPAAAVILDQDLFESHALLLALVAGIVVAFWVTGLFADLRIGSTSGGLLAAAYYLFWRENGLRHRIALRRRIRSRRKRGTGRRP